jgi:hypothetical protein
MLPRPHPLARTPLVDRLNCWLSTAWRKRILPNPSLDPAELLACGGRGFIAQDEFGGRSDEDAADFRDRLAVLCAALENEACLNPLGRAMAHGQLVRVIRQRFALGRLWRHEPERAKTPLAPPIIVVGQMRSGTTRIHRLLAADPAHCGTRFCNSWHPVPESPDLRPLWSGFALLMGRRLDPWLETLHPFGATRVDEELGWLAAALDHCAYEAQWRVPSFTDFSEARDPAPVYREFARILRTDAGWHGNAHLPRVMKVPQFAEDLAALLQQFPDARLVAARRDTAEVARSSASLVTNQMTIQSDAVDIDWVRHEWERKIALRAERMAAALSGFSGKVAELDFDSLGRDWRSEVIRTYDALGLELSAAALSEMEAEQRRSAGGQHERHATDLQAFAGA